jgi:hypothetical protein
MSMALRAEIKQVGVNGQISLGKKYAGKQIQISELENGSLLIKTGTFIPDNERWLYKDNNLEKLMKALDWSERHPRSDNFKEVRKRILGND